MELIELVETHPDATAEDLGDHCVLRLHGKHSIELSPTRAVREAHEKFEVVVRKVTLVPSPPATVKSYDLRAAVIKRMMEIFRGKSDPVAKILEGFK